MALVPAVIALYRSLAGTDIVKAVTGCGIIAAVIPVIVVLLIVHGRLEGEKPLATPACPKSRMPGRGWPG